MSRTGHYPVEGPVGRKACQRASRSIELLNLSNAEESLIHIATLRLDRPWLLGEQGSSKPADDAHRPRSLENTRAPGGEQKTDPLEVLQKVWLN